MLDCEIFGVYSRYEFIVKLICQERNRQTTEIVLQHRGHAADIVETIGIPKIKGEIIATFEELSDRL